MSYAAHDTRPAVLFVALQTGAAANGGIASLGEVMRGLRDHRPVVLTNRKSAATESWKAHGVEIHILPECASQGLRKAPLATGKTYARYFAAVTRLLNRTGARVVHANDPLGFQLALPAVRFRRGTRIALNIRDTIKPGRTLPAKRYRLLFAAADHVFFLSRDMVARWVDIVPEVATKASATYSIVDFSRFSPRPLCGEPQKVVLLSGVVCAKKGQLDFLRLASPQLASAGIETWLVGDFSPETEIYASQCLEAALPLGEMVHFLGYRRDLPDLYARAHVVCVSSHYEGLMRTMIEAMAAGRPVVSTDVASAREMLLQPSQQAGEVFPIGCREPMASAIIRLCRDEASNRELGLNGAAIARQTFAADRVVKAYEAVYARLCSAAES